MVNEDNVKLQNQPREYLVMHAEVYSKRDSSESSEQVLSTSSFTMELVQNNPKTSYVEKDETEHQPKQDGMTGRLVLGNQPLRRKIHGSKKYGSNDVIDDNEETVVYLTRHKIDHVKQSKGVCREVLLGECIPCCDPEARQKRNIGTGLGIWMLWSIIRSEVFIYGLHIFSLALGATKEVISTYDETPYLELIQSVIETAATLLLLTIRMANSYAGYRAVRSSSRPEENYDPDKDTNVQKLKRWMKLFIASGVFLYLFSAFAFVWFYFHAHLGWTILTNNFSMITMYALSTVFGARVAVIFTRIRDDQHKVVIHDAVIFIEETNEVIKRKTSSTEDRTERSLNNDDIRTVFVRAVRSTKLFDRPSYIEYVDTA